MAEILTADEIKRRYGAFYQRGARLHLDARNVPDALWSLLPYAEFWGIADDRERENLVKAAPAEVKHNLKSVADAFEARTGRLAGRAGGGPADPL